MWTDSCKSQTPPKFSYRSARKRRKKEKSLDWANMYTWWKKSAPMLELAHPCKSTGNPKQDRHYRWDRCGCLYDTPHLCAVYSNAVKNPLKPFCRPSRTLFSSFQCPPPRWRNFSLRFHTIVHRVLYRIYLLRARRGAISMTDQITNNSHPSTTTTDPPENPKSSNPRAAAN